MELPIKEKEHKIIGTEFILATNNAHKVEEIRKVVGDKLRFVTLKEAGINVDIPEPHDTLEANASEKSKVIHGMTGKNVISEDTGLEVFALDGAPGVNSARYAGESKDFSANVNKLLREMKGKENRTARFRTVVSLILDGTEHRFEGICEGRIMDHITNDGVGFGYDPVFVPNGSNLSFAEMGIDDKNTFSHRQKAMTALTAFLNTLPGKPLNETTPLPGKMERVKLTLPTTFRFSTLIPIRIDDVNYGGHVGNDSFLSIVHEARLRFLGSFGYSETDMGGIGLIMGDAAIEFKKELVYGDTVKVSVAVGGVDKLGFDLCYLLEKIDTAGISTVAAKVKTGMYCFDYGKKKLAPLPKEAIERLL